MLLDLLRGFRRAESLHHIAFTVYEKLGEVPLYRGGAEQSLLLLLHPDIQRIRILSVHLYLRKLRKGDVIVEVAEIRNFLFAFWRLVTELVAREVQDYKSLVAILPVKLLKSFVLRRKAASCGSIYDKHDLA